MDSVVNYLEDTEKKLRQEMSVLFSKMREQRDTMSHEGIEDMYSHTPLAGVLYDPCVRIPGPAGYYCSQYKLPEDEYVIIIKQYNHEFLRISVEEIFILMMVPGLDMFRLFIHRLYKLNNPFKPDRNHIHHYFLNKLEFKYSFLIIQMLLFTPIQIF